MRSSFLYEKRAHILPLKWKKEMCVIKLLKHDLFNPRKLLENTEVIFADIFVVLKPRWYDQIKRSELYSSRKWSCGGNRKAFWYRTNSEMKQHKKGRAQPGDLFPFGTDQLSRTVDLTEIPDVTRAQSMKHRTSNVLTSAFKDCGILLLCGCSGGKAVASKMIIGMAFYLISLQNKSLMFIQSKGPKFL